MYEPQPSYTVDQIRADLEKLRQERPDLFRPEYAQPPMGPAGANLGIANTQSGYEFNVGGQGTWTPQETLEGSPRYAEWALHPERSQIAQSGAGMVATAAPLQTLGSFPKNLPPADITETPNKTYVHGSQGPNPYNRLVGQMGARPDLSRQGLQEQGLAPKPGQTFDGKAPPQAAPSTVAGVVAPAPKPKRKKGSFSEVFQVLNRIKSEEKDGKKDTKKALSQLVKQLSDSDSVAKEGNATGTISAF